LLRQPFWFGLVEFIDYLEKTEQPNQQRLHTRNAPNHFAQIWLLINPALAGPAKLAKAEL